MDIGVTLFPYNFELISGALICHHNWYLLLLGETVCFLEVRIYLEKVTPWEYTDLYYQLY